MREIERIFESIDHEIRDLKEAENSNMDEVKKILNRQAEVITFLVSRVRDMETRMDSETKWDKEVEDIIRIMALDDARIWKFRKHRDIYEDIARKGIEEVDKEL
ncbi:MAG: hypothetical protein KAU99_05845 [Thermoplasmata archaeon]|nr:hypothetical protein [Thermoplasmata archaeon]MCK4455853.1 hypothetical protein [Thermoplasmata archaeon]